MFVKQPLDQKHLCVRVASSGTRLCITSHSEPPIPLKTHTRERTQVLAGDGPRSNCFWMAIHFMRSIHQQ
jgi:hypothetical protein